MEWCIALFGFEIHIIIYVFPIFYPVWLIWDTKLTKVHSLGSCTNKLLKRWIMGAYINISIIYQSYINHIEPLNPHDSIGKMLTVNKDGLMLKDLLSLFPLRYQRGESRLVSMWAPYISGSLSLSIALPRSSASCWRRAKDSLAVQRPSSVARRVISRYMSQLDLNLTSMVYHNFCSEKPSFGGTHLFPTPPNWI